MAKRANTRRPSNSPTSRASGDGKIAFCKIFPPIGIARLGNSLDRDGYFLGPESIEQPAHKSSDFKGFRDDAGGIKRQVARFRIFAFDRRGKVIGELTSKNAAIEWQVQLANKKAAWFEFAGAARALEAFVGKLAPDDAPRNANIGKIERNASGGFGNKYRSDATRRKQLEILSSEVHISGESVETDPSGIGPTYELKGKFKGHRDIYLGELRTDNVGRLLVFGGRGVSDAVDDQGRSIRQDRWIQHYANNDDWHDDTSDGFVRARVQLRGETHNTEVRGCAWVIVAPPDYAPDATNLVTLFDVMEEVLHDNPALQSSEMDVPRGSDRVFYDEDIKPIFDRAIEYKWVNGTALRGHGAGKPGDFREELEGVLGDPVSPEGRDARDRIFQLIREPIYTRPRLRGSDVPTTISLETQVRQASAYYMPPLSGDQGDVTHGVPGRWLTVTYLQHARLQKWAKSNFARNAPTQSHGPRDVSTLHANPFELTRAALHFCAGGAFFPGIEMTSIARHPGLYREAYRVNDAEISPGDITKYMAVPWQADFYECRMNWWPAQRPDDVVTEADFEEVFQSFEEETIGDHTKFEMVLFNRTPWGRGLGWSRPPKAPFLLAKLIPDVDGNIPTSAYIQALASSFSEIFLPNMPKVNRIHFAERLPSPARLQFLAQERFDRYSGRFFHLACPSPETVLDKLDPKVLSGTGWSQFRSNEQDAARKALDTFEAAISNTVNKQIVAVLQSHPDAKKSAKEVCDALRKSVGAIDDLEDKHPEDFDAVSEPYRRLVVADMLTIAMDMLYVDYSEQAGDNEMVDQWRNLGFVIKKTKNVIDRDGKPQVISALVETERHRYDGLSYRDYFYILMNIEKFPDFPPYAKVLAERFLRQAEEFIARKGLSDEGHPESFVPYSKANYDAKLEQIYEIMRAGANRNSSNRPWLLDSTASDSARRIVRNAAFNQTDGSWLRNISRAGTSDEIHGLLFDVWSDEIGNGDPALHHGNLYTTLIKQLGFSLPDVHSRAYANHPYLSDQLVVFAVVPLVVSQHTGDFFPEILGMTLFLEWEVLSLVPTIKRLDYLGIDSHFYSMHVGIDNATHGHGYAAKRAVELYLDQVLEESGPQAVQEHWRRVWRGFVAFALGGSGIFGNEDNQTDDGVADRYPGSAQDRVADLMARKKKYGNLQHGAKRLGTNRINDLFDDPPLFIEELGNSDWIIPGSPERSRILTLLTDFNGPMYKVFDKPDLDVWREWILWLGKEGDTAASKKYLSKAESMLMLLQELREHAAGERAHSRYRLSVGKNETSPLAGQSRTVAEWFAASDLKDLMLALRNPENGWIAPGKPHQSPLVVDFLSGNRRMGKTLDRRFPAIGNQIGRLIVVRWILCGCKLPNEKAVDASLRAAPRVDRLHLRRLLVQQYGPGAVH